MKHIFAGPCGIESREQAFFLADTLKKAGATVFRGMCYKGQNRPVVNGRPEYLGLGDEGVKILSEVQDKINIPVVCDMQSVRQAELIKKYKIAYPQVGARNCDSLELLRQFRKIFATTNCKIILKRGPSSTVDEWLGAAEHLGGPDKVILCERGTVHFDRHDNTRFRLDLVGIAEIKRYHYRYTIIADPSHGSGNKDLIIFLSKCLIHITDGLMIEVHEKPENSRTDAQQTIDIPTFERLIGII